MTRLSIITFFLFSLFSTATAQVKTYTGSLGEWGTETYTYTENEDFVRTKNGTYTYTAEIAAPGLGTRKHLYTGNFKDGYRDGTWTFTITDVDYGGTYEGNNYTTGTEKWVVNYKDGYWIGNWTHTQTEKIRQKIVNPNGTFTWGQYTTRPAVNETFKMPTAVTGTYKTNHINGQYDNEGKKTGRWVIQNWESWKKDMPVSVETIEYVSDVMLTRHVKHNVGHRDGPEKTYNFKEEYPALIDTLIFMSQNRMDINEFAEVNGKIVSVTQVNSLPNLGGFEYAPIWQHEKIGGDRQQPYYQNFTYTINTGLFADLDKHYARLSAPNVQQSEWDYLCKHIMIILFFFPNNNGHQSIL